MIKMIFFHYNKKMDIHASYTRAFTS